MFSTVVLVADAATVRPLSSEVLVRTLAALVPVTIEGGIRDLVLAGGAGRPDLAEIAAHAGCGLVEAPTAAQILPLALAAARGPEIMVWRAGFAPGPGFTEEISVLVPSVLGRAAVLRAEPETFLSRLIAGFAPAVGLFGYRRNFIAADAGDLAGLVRKLRPAKTLRVRGRKLA